MQHTDIFPARRITVLLVDDQVAMIEAVRRMLSTERDIDFHFCRNPIQAIKTANQIAPTVILQDLVMPEVDGLTLVRYFRANQATRDVPLIVLSVKEEAHIKAEAFTLGANDYMVKFPDRLEVIARIRYHSQAYINLLERNEAFEQLSIAMKQEQERARELIALSEMSDALQNCTTEVMTHVVIAKAYQALCAFAGGCLSLRDHSSGMFRVVTTWGDVEQLPSEFRKEDCQAICRGAVHSPAVDGADALCVHLPEPMRGSTCCIPIMGQGEALGGISLWCQDIRQLHKYLGDKGAAIFRAADHYALALANLHLRERLKIEAIHDPLTGVYNRHYMEESLEREILRAERHKTNVGLIMMDIDHFKRFNDTYGHDLGDCILRELVKCIRANLRAEDIICRYGGEEFFVIIPDIDPRDLLSRANYLCQEVRTSVQIMHRAQKLSITISLGVASFPEHGKTAQEALRAADQALYQAKRGGRDRAVAASSPMM